MGVVVQQRTYVQLLSWKQALCPKLWAGAIQQGGPHAAISHAVDVMETTWLT